MKKLYITKDRKLVIDLSSIISIMKDEAEVFNENKNKKEKMFLITFATKSPYQPAYMTDDEELRDQEFEEITKLLLEFYKAV